MSRLASLTVSTWSARLGSSSSAAPCTRTLVATCGAAGAARPAGRGRRTIAAERRRRPATVGRWLGRVRGKHVHWLRRQGVEHTAGLDSDLLGDLPVGSSDLADALADLGAAVHAWR